ncbi:MAG: type IX secretion system sortase PorU [Bacteroidales bacterium]
MLFTFILITGTLFSQKETTLKRNISWAIPKTYSIEEDRAVRDSGQYLSFYGAEYPETSTMLPYYSELIPLKNKGEIDVTINVTDSSHLKEIDMLDDNALSKIKHAVNPLSKVVQSRGKFYLQISFLPLFRQSEKKILKVTDFEITYEPIGEKSEKKKLLEKTEFTDKSVFTNGKWLKISVHETGVYKLTYSQLKAAGWTNFDNVGIFGNAEGVLPVDNNHFEDKDPRQNAVKFHLGEDREFNKGDYILFFAKSPHEWLFDNETYGFYRNTHPYARRNYYFVTSDAKTLKRVDTVSSLNERTNKRVSSFIDYAHHEEDNINLIKSGREWFGEQFGTQNNYDFSFDFPNRIEDKPVTVRARLASRSSVVSNFPIIANGDTIINLPINPVYFNHNSDYAKSKTNTGNGIVSGEKVNLKIDYNSAGSSSVGWLDYLTVSAHRKLTMQGDQLLFNHPPVDSTQVVEFEIDNVKSDLTVWDVTYPTDVKEVHGLEIQNNKARFKIKADTKLSRFIAFTGKNFHQPEIESKVQNQNLHGLGPKDMIIVTKEKFLSQANELAELHNANSGLKTAVVTDKEIFNEFSSGAPDPAAIRNYVRYTYEQSTSEDSLKYLMLFGDGSYDNRQCHKNDFLITFQSQESLHYTNSFVSDDFFGMIDENDNVEGESSGLVDIGIGRFPVNTVREAQNAVDKVRKFIEHEPENSWLNRLVFVADDEDNNDHVEDAEDLSDIVRENNKEFDVDKIYLDAYTQITDATGAQYPEVNKAINKKINNGVFLFNYSGHGAENYLAHERILTKDDIASWVNDEKFPVFMTATCEFTRFDDPEYTSAGEKIFLRENAGGIALLSTTRLVYANQNFALNKTFFDHIFKGENENRPFRFGDVVRLTKNNAGISNNKRNFSLFGDPALKLPIGDMNVHTDSLKVNDTVLADTIKARDQVTIYGHVQNPSGSINHNFNGLIYIDVKDREQYFYTKGNDGGPTFAYKLRANSLFKGKTRVKNGKFDLSFIVPNDLSSEFGEGKIIYWGHEDDHIVQGAYDDFFIGGASDNILDDQSGPDIKIYMNDRNFVSGGITNENPQLLVDLSDENGINISGEGIEHDITAMLDGDYNNKITLNQYYTADENTFKEGTVKYQFSGLSEGEHTLQIEAWDINNNYSSSSLDFVVSDSSQFLISKVYNNPNPFSNHTKFYFEHNRPGEPMEVTLSIYDLSGSLLLREKTSLQPSGYRVGPVSWNGVGNLGNKIETGIYIYQIKIRLKDGETDSKSDKLMIVR